MLRNALPIATLALLGSGCSMAGNSGIWMFFVAPFPDQDCEETITHNFSGANPPTDAPVDEEWTDEETYDGSDGIVFAQIFGAAGEDQKIMVIGNRTYLGNKEGGTWTFRWEGFEDQTETSDHQSGYHYSVTEHAEGVEEFVVEISGNTLTGTWGWNFSGSTSFDESDQWDGDAVGQNFGDIPSGSFLIDSQDQSVWNISDSAECTSNPCNLTLTESCSNETSIEGRQTDYDEDAYYGVSESGQPIGLDL